MSGRLSKSSNQIIQEFPSSSWKTEFAKSKKCGFETIEWVFDDNPNPLMNDYGLEEIRTLSNSSGIKIISVIADIFMNKMLFGIKKSELQKNIEALEKLIIQCSKLDISILEIPFVDSSSMHTIDDQNEVVTNLEGMVEFAEKQNVKITFETDLPPTEFKNFLEKFPSCIGANYDTGNSAALGYDVKKELVLLKPWITNIHIKDRIFGGKTVPFGEGDTDFESFFSSLYEINFNGQLILQGARENEFYVTPEETCLKYLKFVQFYLRKYNLFSFTNE